MQDKIIALWLLLPIISLGASYNGKSIKGLENGNVQKDTLAKKARIEELSRAKIKTELEAVEISSCIFKATKKLVSYKERMFKLYKDPAKKDRSILYSDEFDKFVLELCCAFNKGEDIKPLVDKAHLYRKKPGTDIYLMYKTLIIHQIAVDNITTYYREVVQKLTEINKELHELDPI